MTLPSSTFRQLSLAHHAEKAFWRLFNETRYRTTKIDFVQLVLPSSMAMFPEPRNWIRQRIMGEIPLSVYEFDEALEQIALDPRPKGIILYLQGLSMSSATIQAIRNSLKRFKESGKTVICYAKSYDLKSYYLASIADKRLLQPGGSVWTMGLYQQQLFLKESLETIGIEVESVAISPYKGAADPLTRTEPSPEGEAQTNWLLDSLYETIISEIAEGCETSADDIKAMIDTAPHIDQAALEKGYVHALVNEEDFAGELEAEHIVLWEQAKNSIHMSPPSKQRKSIAILPLSGTIVDGTSRKPPVDIPLPFLGGERMGDHTVVQQVRNLMKDDSIAAVILYIDSGGGSATASEAMTAALQQLAANRPLIVVMGGVAASGGYYIATPAQWIICQPTTITGSIGVINAKVINRELQRKLKTHPAEFMRGANANLLSSGAKLTEQQREQLRESISSIYQQFIGHVATSRDMSTEAVNEIGGGRVWTGKQALENGLCDQLGGLPEAITKAQELACLPDDTPVKIIHGSGKPLPAQLAEVSDPAAILREFYAIQNDLLNGKPLYLMPMQFRW